MTDASHANPTKRPTLRDVATFAGVSFKTVSRVVNDERGVSDAMRARVRGAVEELGYQPDNRAAALRSNSSASAAVGFLQVDVRNPFFAWLLRGLEDVLDTAGFVVLSASTDARPDRQDELLRTFISRRVDGLVVVPYGHDHSLLEREIRRGTPVVCVDVEPEGLDVDVLLSDNLGGSEAAVRHLIAHGHHRIAYLGDGGDNRTSRGREAGYRKALAAEGLDVDPSLILQGVTTPEQAHAELRQLLLSTDAPTAVFSSQNMISRGALKAIHHVGLQHRVAFVSFDDVEFSDVLTPAITVAPQDPLGIGRRAAELLLARLADPTRPPVREIMPIPLIPRGSGEIPGPAFPYPDTIGRFEP